MATAIRARHLVNLRTSFSTSSETHRTSSSREITSELGACGKSVATKRELYALPHHSLTHRARPTFAFNDVP